MSPEIIGTTSSTAALEESLPALDYSLRLLRQLRDVVISAGENKVKFFAHRAILEKDPFFAALFKVAGQPKTEYHLEDEHPDVLRRRIEKAYSEKEETVVLRTKKTNHVNGEGKKSNKSGCSLSLTCCFSPNHPTETITRSISPERNASATSHQLGTSVKITTFAFERNGLSTTDFPFNVAMELDKELIKRFETNSDAQKCFFTYFLLDPVLSANFGSANSLAVQILTAFFKFSKLTRDNYYRIAIEQVNSELFKKFVTSIFFVGTGEGNQMGKLLFEPELLESGKRSKKVARI